ncbi:MAG: alkaline phosphatase D family protein [Planctomycetota bacterium]
MTRPSLIVLCPTVLCLLLVKAALADEDIGPINAARIDTIAFGSCAKQSLPQPVWDAVVRQRPDVFLFIGDNVYADKPAAPESPGDIAAAYRQLGAKPGYQRLRRVCPILATWDDHDFGLNDAGKQYPLKRQSQTLLLSFFDEPAKSPRWSRDGVYGAWMFGPAEQRAQILLLDTRFFRDDLLRHPAGRTNGLGPYAPHPDAGPTLLGEPQWEWLEAQLNKPAAVRIIASSIQVVPSEHGWEGWCTFPAERQRLYDLIGKTGAGGVMFVSGDRHLMEISCDRDANTPYPLWDFTSSGMTDPPGEVNEPNRYRVGPTVKETVFGVIRIDWSQRPRLTLEGRNQSGALRLRETLELADLQPATAG